ncbi:MAG: 2OG-Fe dioxygenase family protein [Pseudomonadales bacterium]
MNAKVDFFLQLGQLSQESVAVLAPSFDNLPGSDYLDGAYRLRRYSHFKFDGETLLELPAKAFSQSDDLNTFQGNVAREYQSVEADIVASDAFKELFVNFKSMANIADETPIEVHQIRILANANESTPVAPEGVHQDGFDRLAVFVIARQNVSGGEVCVHCDKEQAPIFKHSFDKGEFVVLNDKRFWHSAGELVAQEDDKAFMDVIVLTA